MFVDHAKIFIKAGSGGNGCLAFRREKYVPRGGPSGGNGGEGGSVYLRSNPQLNTLLSFKYQQHFEGERGRHGEGSNRHGRDGEDRFIDVPVGTQVYDEATRELLFDLDRPDMTVLAAQGGRGGRGNASFATSTNQAPRRVEQGHPGEEKVLVLELKVLADVGLVGYPNAGKSTLISVISAAKPKIADYPFTTLTPNLGVVQYNDYSTFVVADIPGLIEGAHEGSGLGDLFLRHVERTKLLVHLIDVSDLGDPDPVHAYETICHELELYSPELTRKKQIVVASKMDAVNPDKRARLADFCLSHGFLFNEISAATGQGIRELKDRIVQQLAEVQP
ncbi:MAG: GTPase ObgE [Acidobacteria bacterium]|nr:MAG: GTPase ObgE [Acidobacteriota bacterium]